MMAKKLKKKWILISYGDRLNGSIIAIKVAYSSK